MYPKNLKGVIKWPALCFGLIICVASFQALSEAPQSLKEKCLTQNYPPPPADKTKLPEPVKSCIQMIVDLCQRDKNGDLKLTLKEQAALLKSALKGLEKNLPYYDKYYSKPIGFVSVKNDEEKAFVSPGDIHSNLFNDIHIDVFWEPLWEYAHKGRRMDIADHFLWQRVVSYNLESDTGPESFSWDWQHQIYKGLYCISHGKLPPAS